MYQQSELTVFLTGVGSGLLAAPEVSGAFSAEGSFPLGDNTTEQKTSNTSKILMGLPPTTCTWASLSGLIRTSAEVIMFDKV